MKTIIFSAITLFCAYAFAGSTPQPRVDWKEVQTLCNSNWTAYKAKLQDLRPAVKMWLSGVNDDGLAALVDHGDPVTVFVQWTWPEDLKRDRACGDLHAKVIDAVMNSSTAPEKRQEAVEEWKNCVMTKGEYEKKLPKPLDKIYMCYVRQAKNFADR